MKIQYNGETFIVKLVDDGTLDTVLSVNGYEVRFMSDYARDENGNISMEVIYEAIEAVLPIH